MTSPFPFIQDLDVPQGFPLPLHIGPYKTRHERLQHIAAIKQFCERVEFLLYQIKELDRKRRQERDQALLEFLLDSFGITNEAYATLWRTLRQDWYEPPSWIPESSKWTKDGKRREDPIVREFYWLLRSACRANDRECRVREAEEKKPKKPKKPKKARKKKKKTTRKRSAIGYWIEVTQREREEKTLRELQRLKVERVQGQGEAEVEIGNEISEEEKQVNMDAEKVKEKAREVVVEDYNKVKTLTVDAAKSGAWLYPIKGVVYFLTHRALWKPLASKFLPTLGLSVAVVVAMFAFTYLPQLAILVFVNGPLAVFTTVLLILSESSTIITMVSKSFLIQDALVDTFDGTLVARHETGIVAEGRQLKSGSNPIDKLGKLFKSPFEKFTPKACIRYVMYLPLNFIPVVGTVIFVLIQGRTRGQSAHTRYFQLKKWSASEQRDFLKRHVGPYTAFGTVATVLELIPVASIFFSFTNTVGAALWAADIEKNGAEMTKLHKGKNNDTTAPGLREAAKKSE